ncbi:MAG: caspase family protein [Saprospiraceae bacterium]
MTNRFEHAYALVIGMDALRRSTFSHLQTKGEANAQALHTVLVAEDRCAYKLKNVISIIGEDATRHNIVNGFLQLEEKLRQDESQDKTAFIYFSGYEIKHVENTAPLYLIPHDVVDDLGSLFQSALNVNVLNGLIQSLPPSHLFFLSDSQSLTITEDGGLFRPIPDPPPPPDDNDDTMGGPKPIPDPPPPPDDNDDTMGGPKPIPDPPPPPDDNDDTMGGPKPIPDPPPPPDDNDDTMGGPKPIPNPAASKGQTLLFSTTGDEHSLVLPNKGISTFTWHLLEALSGYSDFARDGRTMVTAHEVWSYLAAKVPATAIILGKTQTPVSFSNGIDFPVGLLMGGKGLGGNAPQQPLVGQTDSTVQNRNNNPSPFTNQVNLEPQGNVYALLIGVNRYDYLGGSLNLSGCVRDSEEVERYLKESIKNPEEKLFIKKLRSIVAGHSHNIIAPQIQCAEDGPVEAATRANILAAFQEFLTRATSNDTVFIHFSGHGSFEFRPSQLHHIGGADNEAHRGGVMVAQDSFIDVNGQRIYPISDLELRYLLRKIAEKGPHIVSALDCCFSGGGTRNFGDKRIRVRFSEPPEAAVAPANRARPINSYVFFEEAAAILSQADTNAFSLPQAAKAVSLQACRENELSKEAPFVEGRFGVFTYYLLQVLRATQGNISYRDLTKLVRARVMAKAGVSFQSPQIDATDLADIDLGFLSTTIQSGASHFTVSPISATEAWLDAGSLHGIATIATGDTHVDSYPSDFDFDNPDDSVTVLSGKLTEVQAHMSKLQLSEGQSFPEGTTFMKAIVTASPIPPTKVRFVAEKEGEEIPLNALPTTNGAEALENAINLLRAAIAKPTIKLVSEALPNEGFQFRIIASVNGTSQKFQIKRREDNLAMTEVVVPSFSAAAAETVIAQMEHITRWEKTLKLENEHPSKILPGEVEIQVFEAGVTRADDLIDFRNETFIPSSNSTQPLPTPNGELIRECKILSDGTREFPAIRLKVKMTNGNSNKFYHATLVAITSDFQLATKGWLPQAAILGQRQATEEGALAEGQKEWNIQTGEWDMDEFIFDPNGEWQRTDLLFREEQIAAGVTEIEDHFKLIISTEQFDPLFLEQAPLDLHVSTKNPHIEPTRNQLEEFLREAGGGTRAIRNPGQSSGTKVSDWWSTTLTVRTRLVRED